MTTPPTRKTKRLDRVVDWIAWVSLLLLILQPAACGVVPPVTSFHNNRHILLPLLLPVVGVALTRRRLSALPAIAGLAVWITLFLGWRTAPAPVSGATDLRLVTLNLGNHRSDPEQVARVLRIVDADLVLLQEVGHHHEQYLRRALAPIYPQQAWYPLGTAGKAALTRLGLRAQRLLEFGDGATALDLTLKVDDREIRVLGVHHRGWVGFVGRLSSGVRRTESWAIERIQAGEVALVIGDLNSTPGSGVLRELETVGLRDAFDEVGGGTGFTFPVASRYRGWPGGPSHRIDHILHTPELEALRAELGPDASSDHLPLIVELRF